MKQQHEEGKCSRLATDRSKLDLYIILPFVLDIYLNTQVLYKHMTHLSSSFHFFLHLAKVQSVMTRRFESALGGLSLTEFMILYHLDEATNERIRRIDLAEKVGLTASGVTRLLAPMEKIGLIKREATETDARVSFVVLAPSGKRKLQEALENGEALAKSVFDQVDNVSAKQAQTTMQKLAETV